MVGEPAEASTGSGSYASGLHVAGQSARGTLGGMQARPRRNRASPAVRELVREARLAAGDLVLPLFVQEGEGTLTPIASMPGHARLSIDLLVAKGREASALGIPAVALFPALDGGREGPARQRLQSSRTACSSGRCAPSRPSSRSCS